MTPKQERILSSLRYGEEPLTIAELAEHAGVSSATVRANLTRWEAEGTVERVLPNRYAGARYGYRWRLKSAASWTDDSATKHRTQNLWRSREGNSAKEVNKTVGSRLRRARIELGMTQSDLARLLGVGFQQIQKYEQGQNALNAGRLLYVANALGKPVSYFFDAEEADAVADDALKDPETLRLARHYILLPQKKRDAIRGLALQIADQFGGNGKIE